MRLFPMRKGEPRSRATAWMFLSVWLVLVCCDCLGQTAPFTPHFTCQLWQNRTNQFFDGGRAYFRFECPNLRYAIFVNKRALANSGVVIRTYSDQLPLEPGVGEPALVTECDPFAPPESNALSSFVSCNTMVTGRVFTGVVAVSEGMARELLEGKGGLEVHLVGVAVGDFVTNPPPRWSIPPPMLGMIAPVQSSDLTNMAGCFPRAQRRTVGEFWIGPVGFPGFYLMPARTLDLDGDGQPDVSLEITTICDRGIPSSCSESFVITTLRTNRLLNYGGWVSILPPNEEIGPQGLTNAAWDGFRGFSFSTYTLTSRGYGRSYRPWRGFPGIRSEGFIGMQMIKQGRTNYGWIKVRLPSPRDAVSTDRPAGTSDSGPIIEEWAFEPEPGKSIRAGARPFVVRSQIQSTPTPGRLRVAFPTDGGRAYQLQQRPVLGTGGWSNFGFNFIGSGAPQAFELPTTGSSGFFRVLEAD